MDVFPKFIIETDEELGMFLVIGKATFHKHLAFKKENVIGGGWWAIDRDSNTFILSDKSEDFGMAKVEDIKTCIENGHVYTDYRCENSIADKHNFSYKNLAGEIDILKKL